MIYKKEFEVDGEMHSVEMQEEDIISVLDQLVEFYSENGIFGEEIQQNSRCHHKIIDLVSKMCDFDFRII
jgi:hypothetical protein